MLPMWMEVQLHKHIRNHRRPFARNWAHTNILISVQFRESRKFLCHLKDLCPLQKSPNKQRYSWTVKSRGMCLDDEMDREQKHEFWPLGWLFQWKSETFKLKIFCEKYFSCPLGPWGCIHFHTQLSLMKKEVGHNLYGKRRKPLATF